MIAKCTDAMTSRFFVSALSLLGVAACGGCSLPGEPRILTGKLAGWNSQSQVILHAKGPDGADLATAPIDGAGNFSIVLPAGAALAPYVTTQPSMNKSPAPKCTWNVSTTPPSHGACGVRFFIGDPSSGEAEIEAHPEDIGSSLKVDIGYGYVDRDVDTVGTMECTFGSRRQKTTFAIHTKTGWNQYITSMTSTPEGDETQIYTGEVMGNVIWY